MAITTRETTATGVTNKGAPLTNAEVDTNFIELQQNKVETTDLNESIDDRVNALLQAGLGIDLDYDDVSGELTIDSNHVEVNCTNDSGASIAIGTPVYQTGVSGNNITIAPADADDAVKMPAIGMTTSTIANGASGTVVILGVVNGLDTSSFTAGDTVYVGTTAGTLTTTAPTGESGLIQNFGRVLKVNVSSGSIAVMGAGRANAVPNLNDGNVFIGNASNQAEARSLTGDDISGGTITSFASTGIDDNATTNQFTLTNSEATFGGLVQSQGGYLVTGTAYGIISNGQFLSAGIDDNATSTALTIDSSQNVSLSNDLTVDTNTLYVDSTNNEIGVGTVTPATKFEVYENTADAAITVSSSEAGGFDALMNFRLTGATIWSMGVDNSDANKFKIGRGGTLNNLSNSYLILDDTGNVGIGDTPSYKLDVTSSSGDVARIKSSSTRSDLWLQASGTSAGFVRLRASANDLQFIAGNSVGMTLDDTGNVGIGTTSPVCNLHVNPASPSYTPTAYNASVAQMWSRGGGGVSLQLATESTGAGSIYFTDNAANTSFGYIQYNHSVPEFVIGTEGTRKFTIAGTTGNVGIGESNPQTKLDVSSGATLQQATYNGQIKVGAYSTTGNTDSGVEWQVRTDGAGYGFRAVNINAGGGNQWRLQSRDNSASWTDNIIVDGGNVGIGVSNPLSSLDVSGQMRLNHTDQYGIRLFNNGSTGGYIGSPSAGEISFSSSGGAERMRIDSTGNVGIGTSSPDSKLSIQQTGLAAFNTASNQTVKIDSASNTLGVWSGIDFGYETLTNIAVARIAVQNSSAGSRIAFGTSNSYSNWPVERMRIDESGNVGIGETSPAAPLHIKNTSGAAEVRLTSATTGAAQIVFGDTSDTNVGSIIYNNSDDSLQFRTANGSEDMRIDSSGNLLVGIASTGVNARLRARTSVSDTTANAIYLDNSVGTLLQYIRADGLFNTGVATNSPYNFSTSGRDAYINSSGQLGYLSSVRDSKLNIQSLDDISWLYQLNAVSFNYKAKDENGDYTGEAEQETEYGLVAEEVEEVNSDLCFYNVDENGNQALAGVTYRKLIPALTKAIQEQQAVIETLQAEVAALKGA